MNRRTRIAALVGSLVVIAILGVLAVRYHEMRPAKQATTQEVPSYWYDPMHPTQHFDKPGKSPFMDMQLVPKYADRAMRNGSGAPASIEIDPRVVQNLGIRLARVEQGSLPAPSIPSDWWQSMNIASKQFRFESPAGSSAWMFAR